MEEFSSYLQMVFLGWRSELSIFHGGSERTTFTNSGFKFYSHVGDPSLYRVGLTLPVWHVGKIKNTLWILFLGVMSSAGAGPLGFLKSSVQVRCVWPLWFRSSLTWFVCALCARVPKMELYHNNLNFLRHMSFGCSAIIIKMTRIKGLTCCTVCNGYI